MKRLRGDISEIQLWDAMWHLAHQSSGMEDYRRARAKVAALFEDIPAVPPTEPARVALLRCPVCRECVGTISTAADGRVLECSVHGTTVGAATPSGQPAETPSVPASPTAERPE